MDQILNSFKLQETLNPEIWDNADSDDLTQIKLKKDIRTGLLNIAKDFVDSFKIEELEIEDVYFVGSLTNYNWSNFSDIDLHVVLDKTKIGVDIDVVTELFDAKKEVYNNNHDIKIKGYDVELYAQDVNEKLDSKGIYSVLFSKWVDSPSKGEFSLDKKTILNKVKEFNKTINNLISMDDSEEKIQKIKLFKDKLRKYRKSGLYDGGEMSNENLVFKYLRRSGIIQKLNNIKTKTHDTLLSVENVEL
jgi:predicted nucleotidyltransferase